MPLFSIITVVRDDLAGLIRTHASLAAQSCRDVEWIVVDGDSRDGGREWLEARAGEIDWWRSAPDGGLYDAMNIGLGVATGGYLLFLNAGDALAGGDTLAVVAAALAGAGWPDFCYGDSWEQAPGGPLRLKPARSHHRAWYGMFTHHQAMFCRRGAVEGLLFNPAYPIGADYAFTLEVLKRAGAPLYLPRPICIFTIGGCSQRLAALGRRDQSLIRKHVLNDGLARRSAIRAVQLLAGMTRMAAPFLFHALRCKGVPEKTI
ncbi:MAG: glycosyltransferase family 2 protein [Rhodospirillaceae bacterium]